MESAERFQSKEIKLKNHTKLLRMFGISKVLVNLLRCNSQHVMDDIDEGSCGPG